MGKYENVSFGRKKKEAYSLNDERLQMVEMQRDPSVLVHNP